MRLHRGELPVSERNVAAAVVWNRADNGCVGEPPVVEEGTLAALGGKHLVGDGIVDQPGHDRFVALKPDRDGKMWNAVQEVRRPIERVDNPGVRPVGALDQTTFFAQESVARTRL